MPRRCASTWTRRLHSAATLAGSCSSGAPARHLLLAGESGGEANGPVAALPLSSDFERARALLAWFENQGPGGQAEWTAGVRCSLALLLGLDETGGPAAPELRRTLHEGQIARAAAAPGRDLRATAEAKSAETAPAAAAPVD